MVPRIDPQALRRITARLPQGCVLVSGTNGKTTTARMLSYILAGAGWTTVHNRAGANLLTGLVTAVVERSALDGTPRADAAVFEVDEATLPGALDQVSPRAIILSNIFRDQLDRYGEVAYVANLWREALARVPETVRLVLNADDPQVAVLGDEREKSLYFGIDDRAHGSPTLPHAADARLCPRCDAELTYDWVFYGHLGHYRCTNCNFARPQPDVSVSTLSPQGDRGTTACILTPDGEVALSLPLPGVYNLYNALAAMAGARTLDIQPGLAAERLASFHAAFGRLERIQLDERQLFVALVKNPVGFNEVLKTVLSDEGEKNLVISINDRFADGTDVSWLWDVDFELLAGRVSFVVASGLRAHDMAVRLKYALVDPTRLLIESQPSRALDAALQRAQPGQTIYVLPTYTAMLEVRELLRRRGCVGGFWED